MSQKVTNAPISFVKARATVTGLIEIQTHSKSAMRSISCNHHKCTITVHSTPVHVYMYVYIYIYISIYLLVFMYTNMNLSVHVLDLHMYPRFCSLYSSCSINLHVHIVVSELANVNIYIYIYAIPQKKNLGFIPFQVDLCQQGLPHKVHSDSGPGWFRHSSNGFVSEWIEEVSF